MMLRLEVGFGDPVLSYWAAGSAFARERMGCGAVCAFIWTYLVSVTMENDC